MVYNSFLTSYQRLLIANLLPNRNSKHILTHTLHNPHNQAHKPSSYSSFTKTSVVKVNKQNNNFDINLIIHFDA